MARGSIKSNTFNAHYTSDSGFREGVAPIDSYTEKPMQAVDK